MTLFWNLRCEMTKGGAVMASHGAVLAAYVGSCGAVARGELAKQVVLDKTLRELTATLSEMEDKHARAPRPRRSRPPVGVVSSGAAFPKNAAGRGRRTPAAEASRDAPGVRSRGGGRLPPGAAASGARRL